MDDRLTLSEAADRLGLKAATLRWQVHNKVLNAERVDTPRGAVWMVTEAEVKRYKREHRRTETSGDR